MKLALAQALPITGEIEENIIRHIRMIKSAAAHKSKLVIFPELSLTGYEPELAKKLAVYPDDNRLKIFQKWSDEFELTIGVGIPTISSNGICISLILVRPFDSYLLYSKKYLHSDEIPFFISGENQKIIMINGLPVAPAICYELSIPQHSGDAIEAGASVYIASVAKFESGMADAYHRMGEIASGHSIPTLMVNAVGPADGQSCAGGSAVWDRQGNLVASLDKNSEGLLIYDLESGLAMMEE